jgi:hypothetical protein
MIHKPVTGRPAGPAPHRPQRPGSCRISRSGGATCANVWPLCPSCPPGRRPLRFRSDRGVGLASPSLEGGLEEFRGDYASRASSSATRSSARASSARVPASSARSEATSAASTSSCGAFRSAGTPGPYYRPRSRVGSPRVSGVSNPVRKYSR